ncbi:hypothetical protein [Salisediminibacterium selenitireducens]|uniref:Uncharacterized protein n=1 Tax=Bacillus selenitireducens (strain ATCC 700615 / DSM 15326 / MLS10) TaxID=439292 RepID=D6Y142_BACIE|nr:hypothetical protein [Salisediminibacterium selenitireducens]ADH98646.1 hypothetical protein Bsel_1129 [[Bacillus] selenitireducens MLS10]
MAHEQELENALKQFKRILRLYPDRKKDYMEYKYFLRSFIKIKTKSSTLPNTAVVTVIRHERPETFRLLREMMKDDPTFYFLTNLDMAYEDACRELGRFGFEL